MSETMQSQQVEKSKVSKPAAQQAHGPALLAPTSIQSILADPLSASPAQVLQLQRQYGNQMVNRLIQSTQAEKIQRTTLNYTVQQNGGEMQRAPAEKTITPDQVTVTNNGTGVTADAIQVLKEIVAAIGETSATITSGRRTPAEQSAVMYKNIENTSVDAQKELYGSSGDKVIDVYVAGKAAKPAKDAATIKQEMTDKINELGPSNVSKHCSENSVIDVAPSSIKDDAQFQTQVEAHARVTKYIAPSNSEPAHHLEIK
ncbi:MAG: hypothetical protein JXR84_21310 [Anaerolineae bacterium]|nr:hypothetical protein [Anaerolineae bacterium]